MVETYTRLKDARYETVRRYRSGVVDGFTCFASDDDELNETSYHYEMRVFPRYIREFMVLSVNERTKTLANQAAMRYLKDSELFDFDKCMPYGLEGKYNHVRSCEFKNLLRWIGSGRCFMLPEPPNTVALTLRDRIVSLEEAKRQIEYYTNFKYY